MKTIIQTSEAPAAIGPYSQAVLVDNTLYCSGQIALHPDTGNLVMDNIHDETTRVLENLGAVLKAADMTFDHAVKVTIFLSDMGLYGEVNAVYSNYFKDNPPAREAVAVKTLPKEVNVEISLIAHKN